MALLIDLFGYLSIVLHGFTIVAQSLAVGGVFFLLLVALPFRARLGAAGAEIAGGTVRLAAWSAVALLACEALTVGLQAAVLVGTVDLSIANALGADFAVAGLVKAGAAALLAALLFARAERTPPAALLLLAVLELAAATLTTHAAARLDARVPLLLVNFLHQLGAALWIGGIPSFLLALARVRGGDAHRLIGARFSRVSMAGVACILLSGVVMSVLYVGDAQGFYGTAYGVMVGAKIVMFLMLLGLGGMNFLAVERLRSDPSASVNRLKRFAEVEVGIGLAIFFAAASLTSVPPAVDLTQDRVTLAEIADRNAPRWPRLVSPDHDQLALPALQAQLDQEAAKNEAKPPPAFVPGSGDLPPRNADDIAWSEYNHHWSGLFVLAIGLLALLNQAGLRWARHWPLIFVGLAVFLFLRSDPEVWPLGEQDFIASFRDVEVLQHRVFVALILLFAWFEWRVRAQGWGDRRAALVFPLLSALGGILLLTHSHAIANIKDQLLIELTHTPLALTAIVAGASRWLELRLGPPGSRIAGWIWPVCMALIGLMLLSYREA
ncbi:MAG: CopD family protein [Acetobacteraceae bacterium]|nr:CopD family protein [Acetobacteraceae bacterium]